MNSPTAAPWQVETFNGGTARERLGVVHHWKDGVDEICDIVMDYKGKRPDANARLIAAAPELLEFAKAFVQCFSKDGQFNNITADYGTEELHEMAREAIRKAKRGAA